MGPVEVVFLVVIVLFGAIGIVRGYQRELGVTTMLLIVLFVLEFLTNTSFGERIDDLLLGAGMTPSNLKTMWALVAVGAILLVTFVSYQGLGLVYPGSGKNNFVSLLVGLINGYLFAGSIWYYLSEANYPFANVEPPFSAFYDFFVQILPPAIFPWQFFILLAVTMLIIRVLR